MLEKIISGEHCEIRLVGKSEYRMKELAPSIKCLDGVTLSVQASDTHYCIPRAIDGPYSHVEVGFPSEEPPKKWAEYFDGDWETQDRTESVYGYVPVDFVREFVALHGGEVEKKPIFVEFVAPHTAEIVSSCREEH